MQNAKDFILYRRQAGINGRWSSIITRNIYSISLSVSHDRYTVTQGSWAIYLTKTQLSMYSYKSLPQIPTSFIPRYQYKLFKCTSRHQFCRFQFSLKNNTTGNGYSETNDRIPQTWPPSIQTLRPYMQITRSPQKSKFWNENKLKCKIK